jgi:hypothetical protein
MVLDADVTFWKQRSRKVSIRDAALNVTFITIEGSVEPAHGRSGPGNATYVPAPCRQAGHSPSAFGATAGAGDANGRMWTASNGLRARERFGTLGSVASWHAEQHAAWHVAWHAAYDSMPRGTEDWKPQTLEGPSACGVVPGRCGARSCAQAVLLTVGRSRLGPFPLTVGRVPLC